MNFKSFQFSTVLVIVVLVILSACVKEIPDEPPVTYIPYDPDKVLTIGELKNIFIDSSAYTFTEDYSVFAKVVMDEKSGNIYKSAFIDDGTGGIQLNFVFSSGLIAGDSVRFNINGGTIDNYNDLYQLNDLIAQNSIHKIAPRLDVEPVEVTISELAANMDNYQCRLIKIDSLQFVDEEIGSTFSDPVTLETTNRTLINKTTNETIIIRTSGYANFAGNLLPDGNGDVIAIASVYNGESQLLIRNAEEVNLVNPRIGTNPGEPIDPVASVNEDFETQSNYQNISLIGWSNLLVEGDRLWQGKEFDGNTYAQASGYNSGLASMETWMITPPVINTNGDQVLSFNSAMAYWNHTSMEPLTVLASTDFDGSNFETATWTEISCDLANSGSGDYNWVPSGDIPLTDFAGNVAIAFKYTGSDSESTSSIIDDVSIDGGGGGGGTTTLLSENFDASWGDFETVSVTGSQVWDRDNNYGPDGSPCAKMSGYDNGSFENDDWLITQGIDLTGYSSATLMFETAMNYDGNPIEVKISTNYSGDPSNATWTTLTTNLSSGSWEWTPSGNVSISDYAGQTVYIGFHYTSTASVSSTWEVDNVVVNASE